LLAERAKSDFLRVHQKIFLKKMKPESLYQELIALAEKLGITVLEHNFRKAGIKVESGLCKIRGKKHLFVDKHKTTHEKNEILASCLTKMPHENMYVFPALRDFLDKHAQL
jgi:hypothetical protein